MVQNSKYLYKILTEMSFEIKENNKAKLTSISI